MAEPVVLYQKDDKIARITLNKPEKLNCIDLDLIKILDEAIGKAEADEEVKVIIFSGAGRAFCSGADMSWLGGQYYDKGNRPSQRYRLWLDEPTSIYERRVLDCSKVTISKAHGYAVGYGFRLFFYTDIQIAAEGTMFEYAEAKMLGPYYPNLPYFLMKFGLTLGSDIMFTGRWHTAEELQRWGVIHSVVPMDELDEEVNIWAAHICKIPGDALEVGKRFMRVARDEMGVGSGWSWGYITHTLGVQQRLDPDDWNIFKTRKEGGAKGAFSSREDKFASSPLDRRTLRFSKKNSK